MEGFNRVVLECTNLRGPHTGSIHESIGMMLKMIPTVTHHGVCTRLSSGAGRIDIANVRALPPTSTAAECVKTQSTFATTIVADISIASQGKDVIQEEMKDATLCHVPTMVGGCQHAALSSPSTPVDADMAGVFILRGRTRFSPLLRSASNNSAMMLAASPASGGRVTVQYRAGHSRQPFRSTATIELSIPSMNAARCTHAPVVRLPFNHNRIHIIQLVKLMGYDPNAWGIMTRTLVRHHFGLSDHVVCKYLPFLTTVPGEETTTKKAAKRLGKANAEWEEAEAPLSAAGTLSQSTITRDVLPNLNGSDLTSEGVLHAKVFHLAMLTAKLLAFREGVIASTDRDSLILTRVLTPGVLQLTLVRAELQFNLKLAGRTMRTDGERGRKSQLAKLNLTDRMSRRLATAYATGNWTKLRVGLTHTYTPETHAAGLGLLRLLCASSTCMASKRLEPRILQTSSWGYICAAETSEGAEVGMVGALAMHVVTSPYNQHPPSRAVLMHVLFDPRIDFVENVPGLIDFSEAASGRYAVFDHDDCCIGWSRDVAELTKRARRARSRGWLNFTDTFAVCHIMREWRILADGGRLLRPLVPITALPEIISTFAHGNGHRPNVIDMNQLLVNGWVEYLCPAMERHACVAGSPRHVTVNTQFVEISHVAFLGVLASSSPFTTHNQGPRASYWTAMAKQVVSSEFIAHSGCGTSHRLLHAQRALVRTATASALGDDTRSDGINASILFLPTSNNSEDAITFSRAALERGMFQHIAERRYEHTLNTGGGQSAFCKPPANALRRKRGRSDHIGTNGLPLNGTCVGPGDALIGITRTLSKKLRGGNGPADVSPDAEPVVDMTVTVKDYEHGTVCGSTILARDGRATASVQVQTLFTPQLGDKFASRAAQKGVIGSLLDQEDMPYSLTTGACPEVMVSSLGVTSRMTTGNLLEAIFGTAVVATGDYRFGLDEQLVNHEGHQAQRLSEAEEALAARGFTRKCKQRFVNPKTGEMIVGTLMTGFVQYVRLSHLVQRKTHARQEGAVDPLTRQPTEGRKCAGGMRFGQMEIECLVSHAASATLRERTTTTSDERSMPVCRVCGGIAESCVAIGHYYCRTCRHSDPVTEVKIGHSSMLMTYELAATGIDIRFGLEPTVLPPTTPKAQARGKGRLILCT